MTPAQRAELDHIFLFVPGEEVARSMIADAGLRVNYARAHPGQGTRNLCACLDDVFLELLWRDGTETSEMTDAITLSARGQGAGSPVGIAWRGDAPFSTVPYHAPFLPEGISLPVAAASLVLTLPFVFRTPGGQPPAAWTNGLAGDRQAPQLSTLGSCVISAPNPEETAALLAPFDKITVREGPHALTLKLHGPDGKPGRSVHWRATW